MAEIQISIGEEFFEELRRNQCYYVDKTEMIYKLVNEKTRVSLFTRPRRFGKTLTMSMLQSFFDIRRDSRDVFEGLDVAKHEEFCAEWMNQNPVLFLSLKDAVGLDFETAYERLAGRIADLCKDHSELLKSDKTDQNDREIFARLKSGTASRSELEDSLLILTRMMYMHYGKPVILLIDEYDVPLARAHDADRKSKEYYPQMLDVIRGLMSSALKKNSFLKFAVITGCLRIAKESIFTGVNNFRAYSIFDRKFSDTFGFTGKEVAELLEAADLTGKLDVVKSWYDGYIFGDQEIFCPWDVLNYTDDQMSDPGREPGNYWKNTSGNDIIDEFVNDPKFQVSYKFETLMNGGTIEQTITDQLTYANLKEEEDNLWSVLLMTGYLTKADKNEKGKRLHLKIPNVEISSIFEDAVIRHFKKSLDRGRQKELMEALWNGEQDKVSQLVTELLWNTISYHNYHEDYYHAFLTGLLAGQGYEVESDKESGLGRADLVIRDRKNRRAVIIEVKKAPAEEKLEKCCIEGMRQINEKKYAKGLKGYTKISCYGIAFFEKTAMAKVAESI